MIKDSLLKHQKENPEKAHENPQKAHKNPKKSYNSVLFPSENLKIHCKTQQCNIKKLIKILKSS